jgi:uncharacterized repeat protein (TIGR01451 family)
MKTGRRWGAPAGVALGAAALVVAVVFIAGTSSPGSLPGVPHLRDPNFGRDAGARLAPLRSSLAVEALGQGVVQRILAASGIIAGEAANNAVPPRSQRSPAAASTSPVEPGFFGGALAPGSWDLRLDVAADRAVVAPGGDIVYTLTVRNVGGEPFIGRVVLRSHVPALTSYVADPVCAVATLLEITDAPGDTCPLPSLPVPAPLQDIEIAGQAVPLTSLSWSTDTVLEPGDTLVRTFRVTVSPAAAGQEVVNHAHIGVLGSAAKRSGDVNVQVSSAPVPQ